MIDTRNQLSDMYLCKSNCALNSRGMKKKGEGKPSRYDEHNYSKYFHLDFLVIKKSDFIAP